ncbi:MAG TPA: vWA domain-containing protein [Thermoanaerobaculia bacterium]|jgi:uncharacterized protein YegL
MRGKAAVAALLLLCVSLAAYAQSPLKTRGAVDWIFLVDTSGSMKEHAVFDDVQASLRTFINGTSPGDSVTLYSFAGDVTFKGSSDIHGDFDRNQLLAISDDLKADGKRTHLGAAISKGFQRSEELMQRGDATRTRAIVLFTDGKEDVKGIANPISIPANAERVQKSKPFIFFVSMAEHEPKLQAFEGGKFIEAKNADAIANVARDIRSVVEPPPPPLPPVEKTTTQSPPPPPPAPEPAPSPLARALKWLIPLTLLAIAALVAFVTQKKRNQLEGELEVLAPRSAETFIGLPKLKATEVVLSALVPAEILGGSDARLFVRRRNGAKSVWIATSEGTMRVNDIEVPLTELYDADTIRIGDARLRFNHVGHIRPEEIAQ